MSVKFYSMPKLKANQIIEEVEVTRAQKGAERICKDILMKTDRQPDRSIDTE